MTWVLCLGPVKGNRLGGAELLSWVKQPVTVHRRMQLLLGQC